MIIGGLTATASEKPVIAPEIDAPANVAPGTKAHVVSAASVLTSTTLPPAGTLVRSMGKVSVTGWLNAVPCGVNAKTSLTPMPTGNGAAPEPSLATWMVTGTASAPAGTTTLAPSTLDAVPPAAPMVTA